MYALQGSFGVQPRPCIWTHHVKRTVDSPLRRRGYRSAAAQKWPPKSSTDSVVTQRVPSPFDALSEACIDERVKLTAPQPDEEEETWEDLLELEEIAWDPTAGGFMEELTQHEDENVPAPRQDVPEVTMAELQERISDSGAGICLLDVSASTSEEGAVDAAMALGLTRAHVPLHELHAEAANRLRTHSLVVVLPVEGGKQEQLLSWQACVRLRRVFGVDQAVILRK